MSIYFISFLKEAAITYVYQGKTAQKDRAARVDVASRVAEDGRVSDGMRVKRVFVCFGFDGMQFARFEGQCPQARACCSQ